MPALTAHGIKITLGGLTVLDGVDLTIGPGDRTGILAPNGVGKSTLLRILAGELEPDAGTVSRSPASTTVVRLAQEPDMRPGETLAGHLARRTGVAAAQADLDASVAALAEGSADGGRLPDGYGSAADWYADALERWLALGCADLPERAAQVGAELGLPEGLLSRGAGQLSGGQQARLALAAVLLAQPDILLLDEPTNDLDDAGLARLEDRVRASRAGIALVSHDRDFLARTVSAVLELDEFTRRATLLRGGWDAYVTERERARQHAADAYATYEQQRDKLAQTARTRRQWAASGAQRAASPRYQSDPDKFRKAWAVSGAQNTGTAAARADRAIARLDASAPEEVREPWRLQLSIAGAGRVGDVVVALRGAVVSRGEVTLGPLDLSVGPASRIRITGPNGSGKTTLVDALLGRQPLRAGERYAGPSTVFGELDQSRREFAGQAPVAEVVRSAAGLSAQEARTLLAKFRLRGDAALRPAAGLSPGERTRAALALLQARGVNCLVLDEPTNHLDIEAIEQLEQALQAYGGALILVTHDRRLAATLAVPDVIDVTALNRAS